MMNGLIVIAWLAAGGVLLLGWAAWRLGRSAARAKDSGEKIMLILCAAGFGCLAIVSALASLVAGSCAKWRF